QEIQHHLEKLAQLMQYVLEKSPLERVTIEEEVNALEVYIQLEQLRLENYFDYSIEILADQQTTIPALLLQPYVEHAILQGIAPATGRPLHLRIQIQSERDTLIVTISDNGIDRRKEKRVNNRPANSKMGQERLDLLTHLTHKNHLVFIEDLINNNGTSAGTKLTLQIPIESTPIASELKLANEVLDDSYSYKH
ncbi:MAG TPA: histidine kinase, partial [Flavisolibacter sp.]|nr:histidine kinase [Flavisolibacter sp.]